MKNIIKTELIEKYLRENNLSKARFCKICKISPTTLKNLMTNGSFRISAIFKVAKVLNVPVHEMFNKY